MPKHEMWAQPIPPIKGNNARLLTNKQLVAHQNLQNAEGSENAEGRDGSRKYPMNTAHLIIIMLPAAA
jgi:hypothetical protein